MPYNRALSVVPDLRPQLLLRERLLQRDEERLEHRRPAAVRRDFTVPAPKQFRGFAGPGVVEIEGEDLVEEMISGHGMGVCLQAPEVFQGR